MEKIRVVISHNDENITNDIADTINQLEYAEVVGIATNGEQTYQQIVDLKPQVVFSKYYEEGMNGLELIKLSKEQLKDEMPTFNIIADNSITDGDVIKMYQEIGNKLSALVTDPVIDDVVNIMKKYQQ
ncbi:MAG: response regulator transcription factor [Clostridia bacterium]|nr:response regulator transcription factor [Clostridia bacterium]